MTTPARSMVPSVTTGLALVLGVATATLGAQPAVPTNPGMQQHQTLTLVNADSVASFARVVQRAAGMSTGVDAAGARSAAIGVRRTFDQMRQHHAAQMSLMGDSMKSMMGDDMTLPKSGAPSSMKPTVAMMQKIETHMAPLTELVGALEADLRAGAPSAPNVSVHTTEIIRRCTAIAEAGKPAAARPPQKD